MIAEGFEGLELFGNSGQPEHHIRNFLRGILHVLRGQLIKGEGTGGNDHWYLMLQGVELAPEADGVGIDHIRLKGFELAIEEGIQTACDADRLDGHFRGGNGFQSGFLLCGEGREVGVAGNELCAGRRDLLLKLPERIEFHLIPPAHELRSDRKHGVGMSMRRNTEKCDFFQSVTPFADVLCIVSLL